MQNNAKVGGILSIVSGVFGFLGAGFYILMIWMFNFMFTETYMPYGQEPMPPGFPHEMFQFIAIIYGTIGVCLALIGVLAIVGGVYALQRKHWGLALAGAIAGTITFFPCGIPAIIFVSLGKGEFSAPEPSVPAG